MVDTNQSITPSSDRSGLPSNVDTETAFRLIDSILPFEACLYHQVIPLSLEGSRLKLGMVNLEDTSAIDYVRRILAYMNCSLVPQTLSLEAHHTILSTYLSYSNHKKALERCPSQNSAAKPTAKSISTEREKTQEPSGDRPPISPATPDRHTAPTLLVDSPEELIREEAQSEESGHRPMVAPTAETDTLSDSGLVGVRNNLEKPTIQAETDTLSDSGLVNQAHSPAVTFEVDDNSPTQTLTPPNPQQYRAALAKAGSAATTAALDFSPRSPSLPVLEIYPKHLTDPVSALAELSPEALLTELLGRVLVGGIGRLYLQRQSSQGRILWSQNGVPQSTLDGVSIETFQAVIDALKSLTRLPHVPVQKPKQVEIERLYQCQRVLLRLRIMPGPHGEEATLQVLRGAALKFYQQQQLTTLSRDALNIAQDLQQKISELRTRTESYPVLSAEQSKLLPSLNEVIKNIDHQLKLLRQIQMNAVRLEEID